MSFPVIRWKDSNGKWTSPCGQDQAYGLFRNICEHANGSRGDGFSWLLDKLASYCLSRAEDYSTNRVAADLWIERYKTIREIK